jgi:hypothetical protein
MPTHPSGQQPARLPVQGLPTHNVRTVTTGGENTTYILPTYRTQNVSFASDVSINNDIGVKGDALFSKKIIANGDFVLNGRAFLNNDISLNGRVSVNNDIAFRRGLYIAGTTLQIGDAGLKNRLFVSGNSMFYRSSTYLKDISINRNLFVGRDVSLNNNLFVNGQTTMNGNLTANGQTNYFDGILEVQGQSSFGGSSTFNSDLFVVGDVRAGTLTVNGPSTIQGDEVIGGTLTVAQTVTANGDLITEGNFQAYGQSQFGGSALFSTDLGVNGNTFVTGILTTESDVSFNAGNLYVNKDIITDGSLIANNILQVYGQSEFGGAALFSSDLGINGNTYVTGVLTTDSDVSFNAGNLYVKKDIITDGMLIANNAVQVYGQAEFAETAAFANGLTVQAGNTIISDFFTTLADASLNGSVYIDKDLVVNGRLSINNYTNNSIFNSIINTQTTNYTFIFIFY